MAVHLVKAELDIRETEPLVLLRKNGSTSVILSEAKDLDSQRSFYYEILRFAQDDRIGGVF